MNGSNWFVLQQLNMWLNQGITPWLATVIETYGSSPRPAGSMMIYHPDKGIIGSLSGGCIEQELINQLAENRLTADAANPWPMIVRYGESEEQRSRLALPCGGHLDVLIEKIAPSHQAHFQKIEKSLQQRQWISRCINLTDASIKTVTATKQPDIQRQPQQVIHTLKPHDKLLIVGAGEVARCLAEIAKNLEFDITLCDFRDEFLQGWQVEGVNVIKAMPDDVIADSFNDHNCAIVALAHDPRVDDMAMMQALTTDAFYVGAMGSLKTSNLRRQRLLELEVTGQQIEKLHAPIGLDVKSRTPYEIAVSIAAQLIAERAKRNVI